MPQNIQNNKNLREDDNNCICLLRGQAELLGPGGLGALTQHRGERLWS